MKKQPDVKLNVNRLIQFLVSVSIFCLLVLGTTHWGGIDKAIGIPGRYFRLASEILCVWLILMYTINPKLLRRARALQPILFCFGVLLVIYLLRFPDDSRLYYKGGVKPLISTMLMLAVFVAAAWRRWPKQDLRMISSLTLILLVFVFLHWIFNGMPKMICSEEFFWHWNPDGVGFVMFVAASIIMIGFVVHNSRFARIWLIFGAAIIPVFLIGTHARGAILSTITMIGIYWLWPKISQRRIPFLGFGILILVGCVCFPFIYLWIIKSLEDSTTMYFLGGILVRYDVWTAGIDFIMEKPFLGYGMHAGLDYLSQQTSQQGHSTYIELLLRIGVIGILCYCLFLLTIWNCLWFGREDKICRVSGAFLLGNFVYQTFATQMMGYTNVGGCFIYLVLGFGVSQVLYHKQCLSCMRHAESKNFREKERRCL